MKYVYDNLVGLDVTTATKICKDNGDYLFIATEDGVNHIYIFLFDPHRIKVEVTNGIITQFLGEG